MIIRLLLAGFISIVSSFCYLSGLSRLMSGLLICFGALTALFFGVVFLLPPNADRLLFPLSTPGPSYPFFLVAVILVGLIVWLFSLESEPAAEESLSSKHLKYLAAGLVLYICSLFIPIVLWFPSDEKRQVLDQEFLEYMVLAGVCLYIIGSSIGLWLLYRSSKGMSEDHPDLMRRFVPALFSFLHLDKMPALVAYLLVYSAEEQFVFPKIAALALAAYVGVGLFLLRLCKESQTSR